MAVSRAQMKWTRNKSSIDFTRFKIKKHFNYLFLTNFCVNQKKNTNSNNNKIFKIYRLFARSNLFFIRFPLLHSLCTCFSFHFYIHSFGFFFRDSNEILMTEAELSWTEQKWLWVELSQVEAIAFRYYCSCCCCFLSSNSSIDHAINVGIGSYVKLSESILNNSKEKIIIRCILKTKWINEYLKRKKKWKRN